MKLICFLLLFLGVASVGFSQPYASLAVQVVEKGTGKPLPDASVTIHQSGFSTKLTGKDGRVLFESSVPTGAITYTVRRDDYEEVERTMNITQIAKENILRIQLEKVKPPAEDSLLIKGYVLDKGNQGFEEVTVDINTGEVTKTIYTNRSGKYQIVLPLSKIRFKETGIEIRVQYRNLCQKTETAVIPKNSNIITQHFNLDCYPIGYQPRNAPNSTPSYSPTVTTEVNVPSLTKETEGGVEITVDKCVIKNSKLICYVTYRNVGPKQNIELSFTSHGSSMTAENGETYSSSMQTIANVAANKVAGYTQYILPQGVVAKGTVEFEETSGNFSRIVKLDIKNGYSFFHHFTNIPVTR